MSDCIFCQILSGKAQVSLVYEDTLVAAFMDIQPVNLVHLLVVPKRHAAFMADVTPEEAAAMMQVAQRSDRCAARQHPQVRGCELLSCRR
jgi:histidine triad (HIT) family protein